MPGRALTGTKSKCGVSPRITAPRQTTASAPPSVTRSLRRERQLERSRNPGDPDRDSQRSRTRRMRRALHDKVGRRPPLNLAHMIHTRPARRRRLCRIASRFCAPAGSEGREVRGSSFAASLRGQSASSSSRSGHALAASPSRTCRSTIGGSLPLRTGATLGRGRSADARACRAS